MPVSKSLSYVLFRRSLCTSRATTLGEAGWVRLHSSRVGSRPAFRAASTHRVCAWRRCELSPSGAIRKCSLSAGR